MSEPLIIYINGVPTVAFPSEEEEKTVEDFGFCKKENKRCYSSTYASKVINNCKKNHRHNNHTRSNKKTPKGNAPVRKYYCESCGYYHLTSRSFYGTPKKFKKN